MGMTAGWVRGGGRRQSVIAPATRTMNWENGFSTDCKGGLCSSHAGEKKTRWPDLRRQRAMYRRGGREGAELKPWWWKGVKKWRQSEKVGWSAMQPWDFKTNFEGISLLISDIFSITTIPLRAEGSVAGSSVCREITCLSPLVYSLPWTNASLPEGPCCNSLKRT